MIRDDVGATSIPVEALPPSSDSSPGPGIIALLHEINAMHAALVSAGTCQSIDLRRTPLSPRDHALLVNTLGKGELRATLSLLGPTYVDETAIAGVWWVRHCNRDDEVIAEFIEIAACPELLVTQPADLQAGRARLVALLDGQPARAPDRRDIAASLEALGLDASHRPSHPQLNPSNGSGGNAG